MAPIAPYAALHETLYGPCDQRPTALQVIKDQKLKGQWGDKVVLITGGSSGGLGFETARALYATGATIYITARTREKGAEAADDLAVDPARPVHVVEMSLDSLASIRAAAADFLARSQGRLNVLINNAGVMACPQGVTQDGFETQFGTNHLGHFLLFQLLKPALLASATPAFASRVVAVSSSGHRMSPGVQFDDLAWAHTPYEPFRAYGNSKLANVLFANELDRRYGPAGIHAFSLHPGSIPTRLVRHSLHSPLLTQARQSPEYLLPRKSPAQGAATQVWAAVARELEGMGGRFLDNVAVADAYQDGQPYYAPGYSKYAYDPEAEKKLWEVSCAMVGVDDENEP